jgi:hypothetical protein
MPEEDYSIDTLGHEGIQNYRNREQISVGAHANDQMRGIEVACPKLREFDPMVLI